MRNSADFSLVKVLVLSSDRHFVQQIKVLVKGIRISQISVSGISNINRTDLLEIRPSICLLDINDSSQVKATQNLVEYVRLSLPNCPFVFFTANLDAKSRDILGSIPLSTLTNKELSIAKLKQCIKYGLLQIENYHLREKLVSNFSFSPQSTILLNEVNTQIFFKVGDQFKAMCVKQIEYFFADNKVTQARIDGRNFPTNVQLKVLEKQLRPRFLRCHKKYLVNISHVTNLLPRENKICIREELIPIGYHYRKAFLGDLILLK